MAELNSLVLNCIDGTLEEIFGEMGAELIMAYLNNNGWARGPQTPERLKLFAEGLREFLGSGAFMVERTILNRLHDRLQRSRPIQS